MQQPFPAHDDLLVLGQCQQQIEFFGRQIQPFFLDCDYAGDRNDTEVSEKDGFHLTLSSAAQNGRDPGHQLFGAEGLGHIIICSQAKTGQLVVFFISGSQHDDRDLAVFADLFQNFKTIPIRHHDIQYNQIKFLFLKETDCLKSVFRFLAKVAFQLSVGSYQLPQMDIVIGNE